MVTQGMTPRTALREVTMRLAEAGCPDAGYDASELYRLATGQDIRLSTELLTPRQAETLEALCARREMREPLQYLCGRWSFLDFELAVGSGVLCPRADTEIVAERAAQCLHDITEPRVLDLCAGTGCIGLGIKRLCPTADVTCVEKSPEAFVYLAQNAENALPCGAVRAVEGDLFDYWQVLPEGEFDLIVSNPPYLTAKEMTQLQPEVAQEPEMALAAGEDGLVFYRAIAQNYLHALRPGGMLALEIGWQQRASVTAILESTGWQSIECVRDYGGNDRCILAQRPIEH